MMQQWNFVERRKLPRYEVRLDSRETDLGTSRSIDSVTHDVCERGIGIALAERIPVDKGLRIELEVPDTREVIAVTGKAVWVEQAEDGRFRAGIMLDTYCLKPIQLVLRMIKWQLKSRYEILH